jgi:dTDP-4-amino-4,6-dideoxygalactose transaminase
MIKVFDLERNILQNRLIIDTALRRVLNSNQFVLGQEVLAFEVEFADYLGIDFCVGVGNGTDALYLSLAALGLGQESVIATVANAGFYSSSAIARLGARPLYLDVSLLTSNITLDHLSSVGERIDALIVTHLYGRAVEDIEVIANYCKSNGILLIEDCAQATGAEINRRKVGTYGDIAAFSFYPTKNLGALGDGGAVATNSEYFANNVRALREYGWDTKYDVQYAGGINSRLDEFQAAILRDLLPFLDEQNEKRRSIAKVISASIIHPDLISVPSCEPGYVAHLYVLRTANREQMSTKLKGLGVGTSIHYPIPDHKQRIIAGNSMSLPNTELLVSEILTIPCYPELTQSEIHKIIDSINQQ